MQFNGQNPSERAVRLRVGLYILYIMLNYGDCIP